MLKNTDEGLGPIETNNSGTNHDVFHAQNHRWGLGPIGTCNSGAKYAVLNAQNHRWGLGPIQTCNSAYKDAVWMYKTTDEGCDPWRLVFPALITLFCMHDMTGEVWHP